MPLRMAADVWSLLPKELRHRDGVLVPDEKSAAERAVALQSAPAQEIAVVRQHPETKAVAAIEQDETRLGS